MNRDNERVHGTIVAIAEKQSQAESYAEAFFKSENKGSYIVARDPGILDGKKVIIIWASGHLLELKEPEEYNPKWKSWSLENFPILPKNYEYKVKKGSEKQYQNIEYWLQQADSIIWAGDIDREGSYISYTLCYYAGVIDKGRTFKRLWVNDLLPDTIRKGFNNLQPIERSFRQALAGKARAIADWLTGMNGTVVLSQLYAERGIYITSSASKKSKGKASIGRVMTAVLDIVRKREQEIETYTPRTYHLLECEFNHFNGSYRGKLIVPDIVLTKGDNIGQKWNGDLPTQKAWTAFLNRYGITGDDSHSGYIKHKSIEIKEQESKSLFDLAELQKFMNAKRGKSAKTTQNAVQKLYDNKFMTYPRTESRYLTKKQYAEIEELAEDYFELLGVDKKLLRTGHAPSGKFVNDKKAAVHSALVPTKKIPTREDFASWSEFEQEVYIEVLKRTYAMFLPLYTYEHTEIVTDLNGLEFKTVGDVPLSEGWRILLSKTNEEEAGENNELEKDRGMSIPNVNEKDSVQPHLEIIQRKTTKPTLFTESTLLSAMERSGFDLEDSEYQKLMKDIKGIGTPATRADTIEKLKKIQQVQVANGRFKTTELGKLICRTVSDFNFFSNPETTASWEMELRKIENGELTVSQFIMNLATSLGLIGDNLLPDILRKATCQLDVESVQSALNGRANSEDYGYCPLCELQGRGKVPLIEYSSIIKCEKSLLTPEQIEAKETPECYFSLFKRYYDIKWTNNDLKRLISLEETRIIKNKYGQHKYRLVFDEIKGTYLPKSVI